MKPPITITILGALIIAAGIALLSSHRENADLSAQVTKLARQNADLRFEAKQAAQQATDVGQRAVELDSQLGSTKARATATESRSVQLSSELAVAKRELTEREQREVALMAELATLRQSPRLAAPVAAAVQPAPVVVPSLASAVPAPPAVDLAPYERRIAELEDRLTRLLTRALAETVEEPAPAASAAPVAPVPYQVVRVGPADTFVVIDYGATHGARPQAVIRLQRGTTELAQVQISDVRPRFSLARVLPGTLKGQLQSGDLVVFTP